MNTRGRVGPSPEGQGQLEAIRQAVVRTLDNKRRLGQYAESRQYGTPVVNGGDAPGANESVS